MNTRVSLDFFFHHAGNKIVAITVEWQPLIATRITSIYLNGENASFHAYITYIELPRYIKLILLLSFIVSFFFFWLWISSLLGIDNSYESCNELTKVHGDF